MESALYFGTLRHRRFRPVEHAFTYNLFMALLDIDEIAGAMSRSRLSSYNRWNWASFDERDHLGDASLPLRERVERCAAEQGLTPPPRDGKIFLLTHLRYLGYNFNPISLFYCLDAAGDVHSVLAEVNNTFGESRNYWLPALRHRCAKDMHVSPFMAMDLCYDFALTAPGKTLVAHMETVDAAAGEKGKLFDATLTLERRAWTASSLRAGLLRHPWMTAKVIASIHWEALRLYWKGAPVYTHPAKLKQHATERKAIS